MGVDFVTLDEVGIFVAMISQVFLYVVLGTVALINDVRVIWCRQCSSDAENTEVLLVWE